MRPLSRIQPFLTSIFYGLCCIIFALVMVGVAHAHDCPEDELIQVDLGNQAMAFVETGSHTFFSGGLAGRIELDTGGALVVADSEKRQENAADLRIDVVGAAWDWRPDADSRVLGDVTYVAPSGTVSTMAGYERILAEDILPGVHATAQSSGRRFELILTSEDPGRLEAVRFRFPQTVSTVLDGAAVRTVNTTVDGLANSRRLDAELLALEDTAAGLRPVPAELVADSGGLYGPRLLAAPSGPIQLRLTVLFGPYQNPSDVVRAADGSLTTVHTSRTEAGSPRGHAMVTELDAEGESVSRRLWIDTGSDLQAHAVALTTDGRVLIAGSQGSQAYLAAYDLERGRLEVSEGLGASGISSIRGLHVGDDGRIHMIGTAGAGFQSVQPQAASYTLTLPTSDFGQPQRVVVGELTPNLSGVIFAHAQDVELGPWRLDVWVDCHGVLRAGVYGKDKRSGDVHHSYTFSVPSSQMSTCPLIGDGWGYILMCSKWKAGGGTGTYNPAAAPASAVPTLSVERPDAGSGMAPDYEILNELEDNLHGPIFSPLPGGEWTHWNNWAYSSTHLSLAFVYYNAWWNSQVAANVRVAAGTVPPTFHAIVLREATFCAESSDDMPHELCDYLSGGNGWPHLETDVAEACQTTGAGAFELEELQYDIAAQGNYIPDQDLQQSNVATWFNPWDGTPFVGDPPTPDDEQTPTPQHLMEIANRLESRARVTRNMIMVQVDGGIAKSVETIEASVASRDTH